ncbi:hypothetical protein [Roseivivax sp. THAF30]|uniref:hypothetical protein n=1 Tax=Roseivivax sp. THAF30 TaxID=2587852 RepID=UPI001267E095|nr:hypothetical protein [Roseivivax sp. THAF30]QFT61563.1 Chromosome partition protein Smc [Roseivivax sp. THAF30]
MINFVKLVLAFGTIVFLPPPAAAFDFTLTELKPRHVRIDLNDIPDLEQRITDRLTGKPDILHCLARLRDPSIEETPVTHEVGVFNPHLQKSICTLDRERLELRSLTLGIRALAVGLEWAGSGLPAEQAQLRIYDDISRHGIDMALITPAVSLARLAATDEAGLSAVRRDNIRELANLALAHVLFPDAVLPSEWGISYLPDDATREICKCQRCFDPSPDQALVGYESDLTEGVRPLAAVEGWPDGNSRRFGFDSNRLRLVFEEAYLGQYGDFPEISMSLNHTDAMATKVIADHNWNPLSARENTAFPGLPARIPFEWYASGDLGANLLQLAGQRATCHTACEHDITDGRQKIYKRIANTAEEAKKFTSTFAVTGSVDRNQIFGVVREFSDTQTYLSEIVRLCTNACGAASSLAQARHAASLARTELRRDEAALDQINHQIEALPERRAMADAAVATAKDRRAEKKNKIDEDAHNLTEEQFQQRNAELDAADDAVDEAKKKRDALPDPEDLNRQRDAAQARVDQSKAENEAARAEATKQAKEAEKAASEAEALKPATTTMEGGCFNEAMPRPPFTKCVYKNGKWVLMPDQGAINAQIYLKTCALRDPAPGYTCVIRGGQPLIVPLFPDPAPEVVYDPVPPNGCAVITLQPGDRCKDGPFGPEITWAPDISPSLDYEVSACAWVNPGPGYECVPSSGPWGYDLVPIGTSILDDILPYDPPEAYRPDPCLDDGFTRIYEADILTRDVILLHP